MSSEHVERRLAAILAADIAGSCRLIGIDEEGTLAQLKALRKTLFDPKIAEHHGRIVKNTGDGALVEFASVVDAVRCADEIQRGMAEHNIDVPQVRRIEFRIGIHVGDIIIEDHDIFGDGVNIAARLEGIAEPGGVCMSDDAYRQVRGKVEIACDDMGQQSLKNIADPMRAWRVRLTGQTPSTVNSGSAVSQPRTLPLPDKPSIAVLPFENMSGDPEQEYFADGMVEEIITALSRNKQLFVIARHSSFTFKGRPIDIKQVARELGVRYVLEGSVRKSGNRVRITGQLIDAASGAHLWADRFDGALEDVFELQDQVAASVVGAIAPSVTQAEFERAKRKPTDSLDAYDYYLRAGSAHWQFTKEATDQAIGLYERAIALDPQFAPAYAALAAALNLRIGWVLGWSADPAADASRAIAHAKTALRLGRQDASVIARSAYVLFVQGGEVELADSLLDEAIHLDPNGIAGWLWGGWTKMILGDHQTAIDYLHRALRLSPLDPRIFYAHNGLAYAYFFLGNYEEGLKCAADTLRHQPNFVGALRVAMACNALSGNIETAQKLWRQHALLTPSERISEIRKRLLPWRDQEFAKLQEGFRLAGMPE
jgi:TolB-like protein/class 3 adenylate cyclase/Flp pilus assembly protein TadD